MSERIKHFVINAIEKKSKLPIGCDLDSFNYVDKGYIDSMAMIQFILNIETEFGIELTESDMQLPAFKTVGGLIDIVKYKVG